MTSSGLTSQKEAGPTLKRGVTTQTPKFILQVAFMSTFLIRRVTR